MPKILRRHFLKDKEARRLFSDFEKRTGVKVGLLLGARARVEFVEAEFAEVFVVNGKPLLAKFRGHLIPTLVFKEALTLLPRVVVDMGAVPHVCNGANVMVPGIVDIQGSFEKDDVVVVVDERHKKPLAIGVASASSQEIQRLEHGSVVKNVHFVGGKLWRILDRLT